MFREDSTAKLIDYIQTLPKQERKRIAQMIVEPKAKTNKKDNAKQKVLKSVKNGLLEIKEAKRTGKKLKTLSEFLNEA
ncbi:MAG: hypothetical protein JNL95_14220 [Chitinophagales bacterium]|nr:hypothetical protein [Chitinophagales bacterium]